MRALHKEAQGDHRQEGIDLVAIARKALKSWFLANTEAMRHWTGDSDFFESPPENMMPLRGNWWHHQVLG
uniref:Uncharacterized protein n=1 Tax=Candidatus Kentrum sp. TC TaxID=2126339 RepID=A0A451AF12_9GAMM|nr:MAG: hypothetical protein BECKTC1821F_GA0114240_11342 [Candidatus Kentron sp. TC]